MRAELSGDGVTSINNDRLPEPKALLNKAAKSYKG